MHIAHLLPLFLFFGVCNFVYGHESSPKRPSRTRKDLQQQGKALIGKFTTALQEATTEEERLKVYLESEYKISHVKTILELLGLSSEDELVHYVKAKPDAISRLYRINQMKLRLDALLHEKALDSRNTEADFVKTCMKKRQKCLRILYYELKGDKNVEERMDTLRSFFDAIGEGYKDAVLGGQHFDSLLDAAQEGAEKVKETLDSEECLAKAADVFANPIPKQSAKRQKMTWFHFYVLFGHCRVQYSWNCCHNWYPLCLSQGR